MNTKAKTKKTKRNKILRNLITSLLGEIDNF